MKLVFISDIHGSYKYANKAVEIFKEEKGDNLVILGDVLYHGPRNPLPEEYNPQQVAELLNSIKDKIIAVRGNCDAEVDQMVLDFPCMADYSVLFWEGIRIYITHGHLYNKDNMLKVSKHDVIIHGHTHILDEMLQDDVKIINPGSISYPKNDNPHSYGVLEGKVFTIKDIDGNVIKSIEI